jgi:hypothetical protein
LPRQARDKQKDNDGKRRRFVEQRGEWGFPKTPLWQKHAANLAKEEVRLSDPHSVVAHHVDVSTFEFEFDFGMRCCAFAIVSVIACVVVAQGLEGTDRPAPHWHGQWRQQQPE